MLLASKSSSLFAIVETQGLRMAVVIQSTANIPMHAQVCDPRKPPSEPSAPAPIQVFDWTIDFSNHLDMSSERLKDMFESDPSLLH